MGLWGARIYSNSCHSLKLFPYKKQIFPPAPPHSPNFRLEDKVFFYGKWEGGGRGLTQTIQLECRYLKKNWLKEFLSNSHMLPFDGFFSQFISISIFQSIFSMLNFISNKQVKIHICAPFSDIQTDVSLYVCYDRQSQIQTYRNSNSGIKCFQGR